MDYSARWYSPSMARFTTQDTWDGRKGQPQSLNRYAYVLNNPINLGDPTGHMDCELAPDGKCGYWDTDKIDDSGNDIPPPPSDDPPVNPDQPPQDPPWKNLQNRIAEFLAKAGVSPSEIEAFTGYGMLTGRKLGWIERD